MSELWRKLRGITKLVAINRSWLESQDERLQRLETDLEALRREAAAIKRYERARWGNSS